MSDNGSPRRSSQRDRKRSRTHSRERSRSRDKSRSRDNDYHRDDDRTSKRRGESSSARMELRLLIASKDAGAVIGRGGDNIKRLRSDFRAGVTVTDSRTPERVVIITGDFDTICDVAAEICRSIEEKSKSGGSRRDNDIMMKMLIHQSQAGCVIGKGGSQLKEFRTDLNLDIKVYSMCAPLSTERVIQMVGRISSVIKCINAFCNLLKAWPPKGPDRPYDPMNYDDMAVREYGGYEDEDRGRRSGRDRRGSPDRRFSSSSGRDRGGSSSLLSRTTQQVSIPHDLAGVIIGKAGVKIKQIRMDSGADVDLSDASGPGDRIITITGTPDQIQNAQYMLQMCVKQHLARHNS